MDENIKDLFAEMFVEQKPKQSETKTDSEESAPTVENNETVEEQREATVEQEVSDAKPEDNSKDSGCDPKILEAAKKELGLGGAAFCDELFAQCPDVFQKLKDSNKTLSGFFNFAYSYALDEYVKKNGRKNGGGYWNLAVLAEKYLDPSVKEGYTISEPKVKVSKPEIPTSTKEAAKKIKKVVKRAAKAAKKEAEKKEQEKPTEVKAQTVDVDLNTKSNPFMGVDLSSLFKK